MHVRATTVHADPARIDGGIAFVRDSVVPALAGIEGSCGMSMLVDRETATATVTTGWTSEQARAASEAALAPYRVRAVEALGGTGVAVELLELAVLDRRRPAMAGFWTRQTRVTIEPHLLDAAIDAYSSSVVHDLQLLPGYCSAVLLVDREHGHGAVSVVFDSRAALEESRELGERVRRVGLDKTGSSLVEVREAQLVVAGLKVPQTG